MNKLDMNLQKFAGEVKGQIDRKYMAHFLDSSFGHIHHFPETDHRIGCPFGSERIARYG